MARIANDFEQINGLFDDTLNAICYQVQAYTTIILETSLQAVIAMIILNKNKINFLAEMSLERENK